MSLLMDALKKAEKEKKQAAKRLQEVEVDARGLTGENSISAEHQITDDDSSTPELYTETAQFSLEPLSLKEKTDEIEETVLVDDSKDTVNEVEVSTVDATEAFSEDLTLENTVSGAEENIQETFEETQKVIDLNDTTIIEGLSTENASAPFDDTFHGVLFNDAEEDTEVYEETLPGVPADQLIKDLGGGEFQSTPVAAKTVFTAGRANKKQSSFKWGVFVVLALLAVGSFAIFYYFTITPVSRNLPSPLVARGIESTVVAPIVVPATISHSPESEAVMETIISPVIEEPIVETIGSAVEEQPVASEVVVSQEVMEQIESIEFAPELAFVAEENKVDEVVSGNKKEIDIVDEIINDELTIENVAEQLPENIQVDSSLISISKSKKSEEENVMVNQAFKAYQDGHYDAAKSIYDDVLKSDSDNRDAHLGLAAIAVSKQDRKNAYSHYVHLLELNPADTLAMNALISLSNFADEFCNRSIAVL